MTSNDQDLGRDEAASDTPPINFDFLRRQTFDDLDLQRELLELFVAQARELVPSLPARSPHEQADLAHRLVGSARAVGAVAAAEAARAYEAAPPEGRQARHAAMERAFAEAIAAAQAQLAAAPAALPPLFIRDRVL